MTLILEVGEDGILSIPADILDDAITRYAVTGTGETLQSRRVAADPEIVDSGAGAGGEPWERERASLARRIGAAWPEGVSAADAVSETRR